MASHHLTVNGLTPNLARTCITIGRWAYAHSYPRCQRCSTATLLLLPPPPPPPPRQHASLPGDTRVEVAFTSEQKQFQSSGREVQEKLPRRFQLKKQTLIAKTPKLAKSILYTCHITAARVKRPQRKHGSLTLHSPWPKRTQKPSRSSPLSGCLRTRPACYISP